MDTTALTEQQLRDYAKYYLALRALACMPEGELERMDSVMELATRQVMEDPRANPSPEQFDRMMGIVAGVLAAVEGG
ncbi:MAG: hypothetical protein ACXWVD_00015 [Telluria sp.]